MQKHNDPVLTVVLPVRNGASTLREALGSTLCSRGVAFEVRVLDHGSTDGSAALARSLADTRVTVEDASSCATLADVLNLATARTRTHFIARMDADDVMHPDRLAADVAALAAGGLDAVCSRAELLPALASGRRSDGLLRYLEWQNACLTPEEHAREVWIEQPLCQPATTFVKDALVRVGGYRAHHDDGELFPEDYDLFLRLLSSGGRVRKREEVHHGWREHEATASRFSRDTLARMKARALTDAFSLRARDVVIAGAGKEGGRIARALAACGVKAHAFVDVDPKKIGRTRHGAPTLAADALASLRTRGAFVVAAIGTSGARAVVRAQLASCGYVEGRDAVVVA
jgi:Glycosyl transferase family 2